MILQNFLQTKKRNNQLVAVSDRTKSENLVTATGTCRPRLPVMIYSRPFVMSQNCKIQGSQWYGVKRIKSSFYK